ncbi:methylcarbamoylase mom protein [Psychrobacter phage vB_PmaS_Y8A]|nr:methylcarbamoylase mom protein [Psychrobacter phage vB_PmaS_Y8A]
MKDDYTIAETDKNIVIDFVQKHHYSKILPRLTKHYLGVFDGDRMVGAMTLGWGTQPLQTITKILDKHDYKTNDYIEIGKMCFSPDMNNNSFSGSKIMSLLVKWLKRNTAYSFLYTLADGIMGKCGYVYQASNFKYLGSFKTSVYKDTNTGEKIHPRSAKQLCLENAAYENKKKVFWLTHDFCEYKGIEKINGLMFRYILPLNKQSKKVLAEYDSKPYPKDSDLHFSKRVSKGKFEDIPTPTFDMDVFTHNFQKY